MALHSVFFLCKSDSECQRVMVGTPFCFSGHSSLFAPSSLQMLTFFVYVSYLGFCNHFLCFLVCAVELCAIHRRPRRRGARCCLFAARIIVIVIVIVIVVVVVVVVVVIFTGSFSAPVGASSAASADLRRRRASARVRHATRARPAVRGRRRGQ